MNKFRRNYKLKLNKNIKRVKWRKLHYKLFDKLIDDSLFIESPLMLYFKAPISRATLDPLFGSPVYSNED